MGEFIQSKILPPVMKFVNTPAVTAIKDGMVATIALIITGSIFLILAAFPYQPIQDAIASVGLDELFYRINGASFGIIAFVAVMGISYTYVKNAGFEPFGGAMVALACFLVIQPNSLQAAITAIDGSEVPQDILDNYTASAGGIIDKTWAGGQGMVAAIIIGLLIGWGYSEILKRDIRIRMPEGVPEGVSNAFTALIPAILLITATGVVEGIVYYATHREQTFIQIIYKWLSVPLQGLTDSYPGALAMAFLISFFWFFGVHGATIVSGIMGGVLRANYADNQAIFEQLGHVTVADGGHIVTQQFLDQFITVTGSGFTIGLAVYCMWFAKSQQLRAIGKVEIGPALFNINEPLMFGVPIVMNPIMAAPFILTPMITATIEYIALATGICPLYRAIEVPWTTPVVISGFLIGDWRTAVLQIICVAVSIAIYFPFARYVDKQALALEESGAANASDDDEDW